jgi:hypothetical protein
VVGGPGGGGHRQREAVRAVGPGVGAGPRSARSPR